MKIVMDQEQTAGDDSTVKPILQEIKRRLQTNLLVVLSYAVWAIVAFNCLKKYNRKYGSDLLRFAYVTFVISVANSTMGLTELVHEDIMYSMRTLLEILQCCLALPCLTAEVWLKYKVAQKKVAYLHPIIGLIPTYIFLFQHYTRQDLIDLTVMLNTTSLAAVGFSYRDFYAMGASGMIFLAYCVFNYRSELSYEAPSKHLFNYSMALFTFCGYKAVI